MFDAVVVDAVLVDAMLVDIVAGPDAGRSIALEPGRYLIGRAPGPCRIVDALMEPHHAILQIDPAGSCRVVQLTGRTAIRVDGHLVDGVASVVRAIELGSSRLSIRGALPSSDRTAGDRGDGGPMPDGECVEQVRHHGHPTGSGDDRPRPVGRSGRVGFVDIQAERSGGRRPSLLVEIGWSSDAIAAAAPHPRPIARPVTVDLGVTDRVVVTGTDRRSVARSMLSRLRMRPDVRAMTFVPLLVDGAIESAWLERPANWTTADAGRIVVWADFGRRAEVEDLIGRCTVIGRPVSVVLNADDDDDVPDWTGSCLAVGPGHRAVWCADAATPLDVIRLHAAGCTLDTAVSTALRARTDDGANEGSNWSAERCRPLCGTVTPHPLGHVRTDAVPTSPPGRWARSA